MLLTISPQSRPIPFSIGIGLLFAATVFPVLAPLPPSLAGRALAFLVFVRNFGSILGITIGLYHSDTIPLLVMVLTACSFF